MGSFLDWLRFILTAGLLVAGLFILCVSVRGVYKFDFVLNRMHAAAMGDTLGIFFSLVALIVSSFDGWLSAKLALILVFWWVSNPVGSHLITRLEVNTNPAWHQKVMDLHDEEEPDGNL